MTPTARCRGLRCASTNAHICAQTSRRGATPLFCASRVVPFRASTRAAASLTLRARVPRSCATRRVTRWSAATTHRTFGRSRCVCARRLAPGAARLARPGVSQHAPAAQRERARARLPLRRAGEADSTACRRAWRKTQALPCVIFLHGNSGCRVDAYDAVRVLLPLNITVFALDLSGSGLSGGCVGARLGVAALRTSQPRGCYPRAHGRCRPGARRASRAASRAARAAQTPGACVLALFGLFDAC